MRYLFSAVKAKRAMGTASSILIDDGVYYGAGDPRRFGVALGYYFSGTNFGEGDNKGSPLRA
ncbi:MAG TPA: hypothetical protein DCM38_11305 [Gammaproteobacteria bacterium]|nr:hypothetical protein [Candidatus Parabeggiatoa sp.]HAI70006.1 hypothetical protein [Gammaproteobacteria bacterium]